MRVVIALIVAGLVACGSADNDPAQRVEKPNHDPATVPQEK